MSFKAYLEMMLKIFLLTMGFLVPIYLITVVLRLFDSSGIQLIFGIVFVLLYAFPVAKFLNCILDDIINR